MSAIHADRTTCQGYGNCALAAAHLFDVDDEGLVVVLAQPDSENDLAAVARAAYDCPTSSIQLVETP